MTLLLLYIAIGSLIGGVTALAGRRQRPGHWSIDLVVGAACALAGGFVFRAVAGGWVESIPAFGLEGQAFYSCIGAAIVASVGLAVRHLMLPYRFGGRFALRRIRPGLRFGPYVDEDVQPLGPGVVRVRSRERRT